jgi:hypothetical protein
LVRNQEIVVRRYPSHDGLPPAQLAAERVFSAIERFLHVEAVGGIVLLVAAAAALIWANSPAYASYEHLWHAPLTVGLGGYVLQLPLHFWTNDGLMTVFFLLVGMEIRREIYEGALATPSLAALPLAAAIGGVAVPALIYVAVNTEPALRQGWAIPTATDIAFAVGVLALLGRSIPGTVRIFLLALAIIDDIAAVLINRGLLLCWPRLLGSADRRRRRAGSTRSATDRHRNGVGIRPPGRDFVVRVAADRRASHARRCRPGSDDSGAVTANSRTPH